MLPAQQLLLQAPVRRLPALLPDLRVGAVALALAGSQFALPVFAQDAPAPATEAAAAPASAPAAESEMVDFEADRVEYHDNDDLVVASGDVFMQRGVQTLRADTVTWNSKTGQIIARGDVRVVDENGNQLFTDSVELTDEFKAGAMQNMLLALREGGRLAAVSGTRDEKGGIILNHAVYSACEVEGRDGCPKNPTWKITARQVIYDPVEKVVRFHGARMQLFGASLLPLPGLSIATDGRAISGLLVPDISFSP